MNVSQKGCSHTTMSGIETSATEYKKKIMSMDKCWFAALDSLEQSLLSMRDELFDSSHKRDLSITAQILLEETAARAARLMQAAAEQHKEMQSSIIKIGKSIHYQMERNIRDPFQCSPNLEHDQDRRALGLSLIHDYVMSNGFGAVGRVMKKLEVFDHPSDPFHVKEPDMLKVIVNDLRRGKIGSSLRYLETTKPPEELIIARSLQTQIIVESILELVFGKQGCDRTVSHMKTYRVHCMEDEKRIQQLVGALLLGTHARADDRYKNLFASLDRESLIVRMSSFFIPRQAPLKNLLRHGFKGYRGLVKMMNSIYHWDVWQDWELPFNTYETDEHSAFSCPILKEQCSFRNPATRLHCGHVISKDACARLTANRNRTLPRHSRQQRFKCPYCPKEQTMDLTRHVDLRKAPEPVIFIFDDDEEEEEEEELKSSEFSD